MTIEEILEKDGRKLDLQQMQAVKCLSNCVVHAGAGSGKTTVLSYRFLNIVLSGAADSDRILTLTFTKKAAAEMKERIYKRLLSSGDERQIEKFADAQISTLDSFFSQIVRTDCISYGIPENFTTLDEADEQDMVRSAVRKVFDDKKDDRGVLLLSTLYSVSDLYKVFVKLFATELYYSADVNPEAWVQVIYRELEETYTSAVENLKTCTQNLLDLTVAGKHDSEKALLNMVLGLIDEDRETLGYLFSSGSIRFNGNKFRVGPALNEFRAAQDEYESVCRMLSKDELLCEYGIICDVFEEVKRMKRAAAVLSFNDISYLAREILLKNTAVRSFFKKRFRYIMIDEFQDNNSLQKDILYLIAERADLCLPRIPDAGQLCPDKLFFVGDEKQSIYGFRGADVSVFKSLGDELAAAGGTEISLLTNYRTEPELIEQFNKVFPVLMRENGNKYEARFESLLTRKPTPEIESRIEFWWGSRKNPEIAGLAPDKNFYAIEAFEIASRIWKMVNCTDADNPYRVVHRRGGKTVVEAPVYGDIALLLRTLTHQSELERAFRSFGIPYVIGENRSLMANIIAVDFFNVLSLCVFPDDKISFTGILTSPLCGLSPEGLGAVLSNIDGQAPVAFDTEVPENMPEPDREKYTLAAAHFAELFAMSRNGASCAEMVSYIWNEWGYKHTVLRDGNKHSLLEHGEYIWLLAKSFDDREKKLSDFISYFRSFLGSNEKLQELKILREESDSVRIMTIHKSKGLEFPIVILPYALSEKAPASQELLYCREGIPFVANTKNGCNVVRKSCEEVQTVKEIAEMKRLLYVAVTRAQYHLVFSAVSPHSFSSFTERRGLMARYLYALGTDAKDEDQMAAVENLSPIPAYPGLLENGISGETALRRTKTEAEAFYAETSELELSAENTRTAVTSLNKDGFETGIPEDAKTLPGFESDAFIDSDNKDLVTARGTFLHKILELSVNAGAVLRKDGIIAAINEDRELGILTKEGKDALVKDALACAGGFLNSELYKSLDKGSLKTERRFLYNLDGDILEGVIDLLGTACGQPVIIDYKSDRFMNPKAHEKQLEIYKKALGAEGVKAYLWYLRSGEALSL